MKRLDFLKTLTAAAISGAAVVNAAKATVPRANGRLVGSGNIDTTGGVKFSIPYITLKQRQEMQNPARGTLVFQTDGVAGLKEYQARGWCSIMWGIDDNGWQTSKPCSEIG